MDTRRQATLFLHDAFDDTSLSNDEVQASQYSKVEAVRRRFNPVQFELIRAHVTLCREDEVEDWGAFSKRLAEIGNIELLLEFDAPRREESWVYLPLKSGGDAFDALRKLLLEREGLAPRKHVPHLTLVHPRNGNCSDADFELIQRELRGFSCTFTAITQIEQVRGGRWRNL